MQTFQLIWLYAWLLSSLQTKVFFMASRCLLWLLVATPNVYRGLCVPGTILKERK